MKKFTLVALASSFLILTACSKEVTEVKKGENKIEAKVQAAQLSTNNKLDIEADIAAIEQYGQAQEAQAAPLQQQLETAMQKHDEATLKTLFPEFRKFVEKSNQELKQLNLKSTEVNNLRSKMIESSLLGLEMSEIVLTGSIDKPDPVKLEPLQQKAMQAQVEIMTISQDIHRKISDQPNATPAPAQVPATQSAS